MSTLSVNSLTDVSVLKSSSSAPPIIQNSSGTEVGTLCRAWVNFNGNSGASPVIRQSFNVSSVTRTGTGVYTINFANAMPDINYAFTGTVDISGNKLSLYGNNNGTLSTTSFNVQTATTGGAAAGVDGTIIMVAAFR